MTGMLPAMERYNILRMLRLISQSPFKSRNNEVLLVQLPNTNLQPSSQNSTLVFHTFYTHERHSWFIVENLVRLVENADFGEQRYVELPLLKGFIG